VYGKKKGERRSPALDITTCIKKDLWLKVADVRPAWCKGKKRRVARQRGEGTKGSSQKKEEKGAPSWGGVRQQNKREKAVRRPALRKETTWIVAPEKRVGKKHSGLPD